MTLNKLGLTLFFCFEVFICSAQLDSDINCTILKQGRFKYLDAIDTTAYFIMNDNYQIDYSGSNSFIIESKVEWKGACAYTMKITKVTIPNFPYKKGDEMQVQITKIEEGIIYYTSYVKGKSWTGRLKQLE